MATECRNCLRRMATEHAATMVCTGRNDPVAIDHRASGHFGKEGINYMCRNLGYWEMKDWITIVKWLIENAGVDKTKSRISGFIMVVIWAVMH